MRALVTGSAGFAGPYLTRALEAAGHHATGFDLQNGQDVRDYEQVLAAVRAAEPDWVFHLAAVSWPRESLSDPRRCLDVNITGALNVLEAVRHSGSHARVLLAGTSEEYGYAGHQVITEDSVCRPSTPYGVSKLAQTTLGLTYARRYGLPVIATRAFNHTGWGRQAVNAESAFARRIVAVERGEAGCVEHGDLSASRNYTSVRDVARAYIAAVTCEPGIYNVCSGPENTLTMSRVMNTLLALSACEKVTFKQVPGLGTPDPEPFPACTADRLAGATGWQPQVPLTDVFASLLDYWRFR